MADPLRVLLVEDNPDDAELVLIELQRGGFEPIWKRVSSAETLGRALDEQTWDVVLSDYVMPGFDGLRALRLLADKKLDIPFILVSGQIGDEVAVSVMKAGCADYVPKENLARLAPAIRRELREAEVRRERRHAREALRFLSEASTAFASSLDIDETVRIAARRAVPRLADWCVIDLQDEKGRVRRHALAHVDPEKEAILESLAIRYPATAEARSPAAAVIRSGAPLLRQRIADEDLEGWASGPEHLELIQSLGLVSLVIVPLVARDRILGALSLASKGRIFGPADLATAEDFASRVAVALDNARLFLEARSAVRETREALAREQEARALAESARRRAAFLAEATHALSLSLDYEATLEGVARLPVPAFADWCGILVSEGGAIRLAALASSDPDGEAWLRRRSGELPLSAETDHGSASVIRTGKSILVGDLDAVIEDMPPSAAAVARRLGIRSYLSVPVASRGRIFGAFAFASTRPGRGYDEADLAFAGEVAVRIGVAIDNALLFREAQEAVRIRDEFLSVASHELKTPLTTLKIQLGNLLRTRDSERIELVVSGIRRQVDRLAMLIANLLDVSQLARGSLRIEPAPMELGDLVREVVERFGDQLRRTGSEVTVRAEAPVYGAWDRSRLDQVLTNLLSNAIKFGAGKPIEVACSAAGDAATFSVRDRGIGIAPEDAQRIFERFERAVSTRHYGGLGLGLFISRQIVEAHGGSIRVESAPGEGSTFTVMLPQEPRWPR